MSAVAKETKSSIRLDGEIAATQIISKWKGNLVVDAYIAATQLGLLRSDDMLTNDRAMNLLRLNFDMNKIGDTNWPIVQQAFRNSRATGIGETELRRRYLPVAVNDNNRFQITWFDDVGQTVIKDELVKGLLGTGEFSCSWRSPAPQKAC